MSKTKFEKWEADFKAKWEAEQQAKMDAVSIQARRELMRLMLEEGLKLGEARERVGIEDVLTASRIFCQNLERVGYTRIKNKEDWG